MSDALSFTVDGQVGEITFTRPDVLNRFDIELHEAFTGLLLELRARTDLARPVLRAGGGIDGIRRPRRSDRRLQRAASAEVPGPLEDA